MIYEQSLIVIGSKVLTGITKDKFEAIYHAQDYMSERILKSGYIQCVKHHI